MQNISPTGTKATLLIGSALTVMSAALIAPALPQMAEAFGGDAKAVLLSKTILTAPAIVIAFFSPFAGWLLDKFGRLKIFFVALVFYAIAGSAGLYLLTPDQFLVSRGLFGIMVAIVMTATTTLVGDYFVGEERKRFVGFQSAMMAFGAAVFVVIAGFLADVNWRYPFGVYTASLVVLLLGIKYLWEPEIVGRGKGRVGSGQLAGGSKEVKERAPFWPLFLVYAATLLGLILFYLIPTQSTFLLKGMGIESNVIASGGLIMSTISAAAVALNYARFKRVLTYSQIYGLCFILIAGGFLLVSWSTSVTGVILAFILAGAGSGFFMPNASLWLMQVTPESQRGRAIGGMVSAAFMGQFLSPIVTEPVLQATSLSGIFLWGAVASLVLGGGFFLIRSK
jgi:MFS family permease